MPIFQLATLANPITPIMGDNLALIISFIFLSSLVFVTNFIVCLLVYLRKSMRTYTNGFVVSLAFSDMLIGSILIPASLLIPDSKIMGYLVSITLLSGVFNLAAVTFDRYISVLKALHYESLMRKNFLKMIISTWAASLVISLVPLIWDTDGDKLVHKVFVLTVLTPCVLVPYMFIFTGYLKIFQQVKRSVARERAITASVRKNLLRQKNKISSEAKLAQVFIIVAVMFVLSWLPIQFMTIAYEIGRRDLIPNHLSTVSLFTVALGSLVNPIVYSFLKPDFRKCIQHVFRHRRRRFGRNGTPAGSLKSTSSTKARSTTSAKNAADTRV